MAIIYCGFVPHQSLVYLTRLIYTADNPSGFVHNEIIAVNVGINAGKKSKMERKKLGELTNEELLNEAKKMKSTTIINATLIGFLIGILIYSVAVNNLGFLTLILLFVIYKFANNSKYNKEEIEKLLKERNLKL